MLFGNHSESGKETLRSVLHSMGRTQWIVLLLLGLLLAVAAMPVTRNSNGKTSSLSADNSYDEMEESGLEGKLEALLSSVDGVGEVRVMLMTGTDENSREVYGSRETEITGVLIAAQGADNPVTIQNIKKAVMALFQIEAHKINIMKMK